MKLINSLKHYSKEQIFDKYTRIVDRFKDYDKITKNKMIEDIIKEYQSDFQNIIDICTKRELKLLIKIRDKKEFDIKKYTWELNELWNKCILIDGIFEFPEELEEVIKKSLKRINWEQVKENDRINEMSIGFVRSQGEVVAYALNNLMSQLLEIPPEKIIDFYNTNKLFRYYIYMDYEYFESMSEEIPIFIHNDYYEIIDVLKDQRKEHGASTIPNFNPKDFPIIFYNKLNINNEKVKKLVDIINKKATLTDFLISIIAENALLYDRREYLEKMFLDICNIEEKDEEKYLNILNEAMDEIPSGALNGCTPSAYRQLQQDEQEYEEEHERKYIPQINASLHPKDTDLFYKLYMGLLEYVNNTYNVSTNLKKIYKAKYINPNDLYPVIEKLWTDSDTIIDNYIKLNPHKFNKYELSLIEEFKKGKRDLYIIAEYEEEYTIFMDEEKAYMVKGLTGNIDEIVPNDSLPMSAMTTLLPFKQYIIYDGLLGSNNIKIGINMKRNIKNELKIKMKYYHL